MTPLAAVLLAPTLSTLPILIAKAWAIGYALVVLCVLLGAAAVIRPSRRKSKKKTP